MDGAPVRRPRIGGGRGCLYLLWPQRGDYERIELADGNLVVDQVQGGRRTRWELDPGQVRVEVEENSEAGSRLRVRLKLRSERIEVGCHLLDVRRAGLARELSQALKSAQGGAA
jgi:uncharacterized membrane protein